MFLNINNIKPPMKVVYTLKKKLEMHPELIAKAQRLTLNKQIHHAGLKGTHGLYASSEWWDNIEKDIIPKKYIEGIIDDIYEEGMDKHGVMNTIILKLNNGSLYKSGIFVNESKDVDLFIQGANVKLVYANDEAKDLLAERMGGKYLNIMLEMAVSY